MKKNFVSRGFTLVELMIVIAIIGILAAVLYPQMTGYFERSRDTNRMTALRNVTLALQSFNIDNGQYPGVAESTKCLDEISDALQSYQKSLPKDPKNSFGVASCFGENKTGYGYVPVKTSGEEKAALNAYILGARVEIQGNSNFTGSEWDKIREKVIGEDILVNVNQKLKSGITSDKALDWYYIVGQ